MTRILIDTDAGIDDSLAIIYAARSPELHIEVITTLCGNVPVEEVTQNVILLKNVLGLPAPVRSGAELPTSKPLVTAPEVHGVDGLGGYRSERGIKYDSWETGDAAEAMIETVRKFGKGLTIVSIGPMTNLARAVSMDLSSMRGVREIIQMGGVFSGYGNTTTFTEFNIFVDPDAAELVLRSGIRIKFVPLDLTEKVFIPSNILASLLNSTNDMDTRLKEILAQSLPYYLAYHQRADNLDGFFLHDPMAMAAAVNPRWFRFREAYVSVERNGTMTAGMTVADLRPVSIKPNCKIAAAVDSKSFLLDFLQKVFGQRIPSKTLEKQCLRNRFGPEFFNSFE